MCKVYAVSYKKEPTTSGWWVQKTSIEQCADTGARRKKRQIVAFLATTAEADLYLDNLEKQGFKVQK